MKRSWGGGERFEEGGLPVSAGIFVQIYWRPPLLGGEGLRRRKTRSLPVSTDNFIPAPPVYFTNQGDTDDFAVVFPRVPLYHADDWNINSLHNCSPRN